MWSSDLLGLVHEPPDVMTVMTILPKCFLLKHVPLIFVFSLLGTKQETHILGYISVYVFPLSVISPDDYDGGHTSDLSLIGRYSMSNKTTRLSLRPQE